MEGPFPHDSIRRHQGTFAARGPKIHGEHKPVMTSRGHRLCFSIQLSHTELVGIVGKKYYNYEIAKTTRLGLSPLLSGLAGPLL